MSHVREAFRQYAIDYGDAELKRHAELGHDVSSNAMDHVVAKAIESLDPFMLAFGYAARALKKGVDPHGRTRWEKRDDPSHRALRAYGVAAGLSVFEPKPSCVEIQVLPVQRVIETQPDGSLHKSTGVVVRFVAPNVGERVIIIDCED